MFGVVIFFAVLVVYVVFVIMNTYIPPKINYAEHCSFNLLPVGIYGGWVEGNLNSVLISRRTSSFISLDAGTILSGLIIYLKNFKEGKKYDQFSIDLDREYILQFGETYTSAKENDDYIPLARYFLERKISSYFLGNSNLFRVSGLILNSPNDTFGEYSKPLLGLDSTIEALKKNYFNNVTWPDLPSITNQYIYKKVDDQEIINVSNLLPFRNKEWENVSMKTFRTCSENNSTAFLFNTPEIKILYFSDTGIPSKTSDCDWKFSFKKIWEDSLLKNLFTLKVMIIGVSFLNNKPDHLLFGHLRPKDLLNLLNDLKNLNPDLKDLSHLTVYVQNYRPEIKKIGDSILEELNSGNDKLKIKFKIFEQGKLECI